MDTPSSGNDGRLLVKALLAAVREGPRAVRRLLAADLASGEVIELLEPIAFSPGLRLGEELVNGRRIDIRATADAGREWWLVLELASAPTPTFVSVHAFERPADFNGVPRGFVVVLRGPSSSGKSSLMAAVGRLSATPWVVFDEPLMGIVPLRFMIWPEAKGPLEEGYLAALPAFARAGNQVLTSSGTYSEDRLRAALKGIPSLFVRLDCRLDVLIERQRGRPDRWAGLAEETSNRVDTGAYDLRIDTEVNNEEASARLLLARVALAQR